MKMEITELALILSPLVIISLIISMASEYCPPEIPLPDQQYTMVSVLNPACFLKLRNLEPPEIQDPYHSINITSYSAVASGTSLTTTQTLQTPYQLLK